MDFTKVHSLGNDFIVIESRAVRSNWRQMARRMCHRRFGVGADGLLLVLPSSQADLRVRIFNADGSEAEICGNGLISLGKYAAEKGLIDSVRRELTIETLAGNKKLRLLRHGDKIRLIEVGMDNPRFLPQEIPVSVEPTRAKQGDITTMLDYPLSIGSHKLLLSFISMGNPHAVHFITRSVDSFPLSKLGPLMEYHSMFPQRVNFEVAKVVDRSHIEARVWERGAGETPACGSGACAISVAARLHNYVGDRVNVKLPGGVLRTMWQGHGEVKLSGSSETVFTGKWLICRGNR